LDTAAKKRNSNGYEYEQNEPQQRKGKGMKTRMVRPGIQRIGLLLVIGIAFGFISLTMAGCASMSSSGSGAAHTPLYYDGFNDILIPGEMSMDKKASSIFQTKGYSAGLLVFKGRVERGSVIAFFNENMVKDGWKPLGSVTSPRTMLLFQKDMKYCVLSITEGSFNTQVEIAVIPSRAGTASMSSTTEMVPAIPPVPEIPSETLTE
jgi:hypothetical protein